MTKDFDDFVRYAESDEARQARNTLAEQELVAYQDAVGEVSLEDVCNIAYSAAMAGTMELLRQYHDWAGN